MTIKERLPAAGLALLLVLTLLLSPMSGAHAEEPKGPYTETERFNVVLVVDKSGSLVSGEGGGTDPDGLRFEALRMFLGLLTESGNNVGAIVFDEHIRLDTGLKPMKGMEDKLALIREMEDYYPAYDTDIGTAMLRAVEELHEEKVQKNGLPCMILLFSDGMTDFTTGDVLSRFRQSWDRAQWALEAAQELGIVINGVLLNVDGQADERGREEFNLYTYGTKHAYVVIDPNEEEGKRVQTLEKTGEYEEVKKAEDLGKAFLRLYHIINNTEYKGAQRVAFSEQGEAEYTFTVPSFGVEEVNIVVEGGNLQDKSGKNRDSDKKKTQLDIFGPDGERFDCTGHEMDSDRYLLVKIPIESPALGEWTVRLRGEPGDWVDVTKVYNSFLLVSLGSGGDAESSTVETVYKSNTPYVFRAAVTQQTIEKNSRTFVPTEEQLRELSAKLTVEELSTGLVREYPMELADGGYACEISFPRGGDYSLRASVGIGDFVVLSNEVEIPEVQSQPIEPTVNSVSDMLEVGYFHDGCWEVELSGLFGIAEGSGIAYTLSDDYNGELTISGDVLQARFKGEESASFIVTATDAMGQSAQIPFNFRIPAVEAKYQNVSEYWSGHFSDDCWEAELDQFFDDPKGGTGFALSDDCDGAVTIDGGKLLLRFRDKEPLSFTVTATDIFTHEAKSTFRLDYPTVAAKVKSVTDMLKDGKLEGNVWTADLDAYFVDPKGFPLDYTLSDDYDGALTIEDGILTMDVGNLKSANFTVTASDIYNVTAELPFTLRLPGPSAVVGGIAETIRTGLFQEGTWETVVTGMFRDPKGTKLSYSLSDDFGGAVRIENGALHASCKGLKKAEFSVRATDEYDLSAEVPITLTEKNMTIVYALYALAGLAGLGFLLALLIVLRNRYF